ncbi:hypothetical protein ACFVYE_44010 [Streptomyces sp. NPDC058239]|uniref:hypothetical protein n=1 Tax=Streptomyces sp. NPDC058239 TaxID=3346395 RepID=UPI0036F16464
MGVPVVRTMSIERKFFIGVAALCVGSWATGARTRFLGRRRRMAAFSTMTRDDGSVVEIDHRRPPVAEFGVLNESDTIADIAETLTALDRPDKACAARSQALDLYRSQERAAGGDRAEAALAAPARVGHGRPERWAADPQPFNQLVNRYR